MKIAVVAPSNMLSTEVPPKVIALAQARYGAGAPEIVFHPQCFLSSGHFAGADKDREDALVDVANDPTVDAVWCARGGYGANRIAAAAIKRMSPAARAKPFLGYSDAGFLLAALLAKGIGRPVHAPMPIDINREGGNAAVARSLDWMMLQHSPRLEYYFGDLPYDTGAQKYAAFNLIVLSALLGTPLEPDFTGRTLMIEEVDEAMYRIDRALFHVTSHPGVRKAAGLMLGRCAPIKPNTPDFGTDEETVTQHWCFLSGIPYLGRADIGHDADNQVVPFG
ncbi:MAG: LD-carboxypeptidase [Sphingomonadaceae bacterium]